MSAEPYYQDDHVTLYHGDCLDVLPALSGVGCVVTSPPYNLSGDGNNSAGTYFRNLGADGQPRLEDGTVDVRALCARWDADANRGAGEAR